MQWGSSSGHQSSAIYEAVKSRKYDIALGLLSIDTPVRDLRAATLAEQQGQPDLAAKIRAAFVR